MPSILFIGDHLCFPPYNGTGRVYRGWLDALQKSRYDTYAIFFERFVSWPQRAKEEASQLLEKFATVNVNDLLEARNEAWTLIEKWRPDIILISKEHLCYILGQANLSQSASLIILDMHDDFEARQEKEKLALRQVGTDTRNIFLQNQKKRSFEIGSSIDTDTRLRIFDTVDAILIANSQEKTAIAERHPHLRQKLNHVRWNLHRNLHNDHVFIPSSKCPSKSSFTIGFCGSQELFNCDALEFFLSKIVVLLDNNSRKYECLVAGSICDLICDTAMNNRTDFKVNFIGMIDDIGDFYRKIDCVVCPLRFGTGVSIKTLEAMAEAKTVICTSTGARGIPICDKFNGFVSDDPSELAAAIELCCRDWYLNHEVGFRGHKLVSREFGPSNIIADLERSLLNARGSREYFVG